MARALEALTLLFFLITGFSYFFRFGKYQQTALLMPASPPLHSGISNLEQISPSNTPLIPIIPTISYQYRSEEPYGDEEHYQYQKEPIPLPTMPKTPHTISKKGSDDIQAHSVGIIYYFHVPKTGGSYVLSNSRGQGKMDSHWSKTVAVAKLQSELQFYIDGLENSTQMITFAQHTNQISVLSTLEWLIPIRDQVRKRGYYFDIFITLRNPIDYALSTFNYYKNVQHLPELPGFEEWINTASNIQTNYLRHGNPATYYDFYYQPWQHQNGTVVPDFSLNHFMEEYDEFLLQIDYIGFTSQLDQYAYYLKQRYSLHIQEDPVNISPKVFTMEDISVPMMQTFMSNNILDFLLLEKAKQRSASLLKAYIASGWRDVNTPH